MQLDRADFVEPERPWLVTVFASSACLACRGTWSKAELLASEAVAVQEVDSIRDQDLHDRYRVDAVPMVLVADAEVRCGGPSSAKPTATDLWAAPSPNCANPARCPRAAPTLSDAGRRT